MSLYEVFREAWLSFFDSLVERVILVVGAAIIVIRLNNHLSDKTTMSMVFISLLVFYGIYEILLAGYRAIKRKLTSQEDLSNGKDGPDVSSLPRTQIPPVP